MIWQKIDDSVRNKAITFVFSDQRQEFRTNNVAHRCKVYNVDEINNDGATEELLL